MVRFLDKEKEMDLLGELFDILYENMEPVVPFDGGYQEERAEWIACVGAALRKPPRQILLLCAGEQLAGFCMYYINGDTMMVEEVQIRGEYQKTVLSAELFRFIRQHLLPKTGCLEAYADRRNTASQLLMRKLGMELIGDDGRFVHFRMDTSKT